LRDLAVSVSLFLVALWGAWTTPVHASEPNALSVPPSPAFRFHLVNEPSSLKPWEQKNSSGSYLLAQLTGTLMSYQDKKLRPNLAKKCSFSTPTKITCELKPGLKWSNGKPLTPEHFVRAFQSFVDAKNKAPQVELLLGLKNARAIFQGEKKPEALGVKTNKKGHLEISLENPDVDFIYSLANPLLAPLPDSGFPTLDQIKKDPKSWISSGAYSIEKWDAPELIRLTSNSQFWKSFKRPPLEISVIAEDSVALNLYEKEKLDFLRRLPTVLIPKFKDRRDFIQIEQFRFDYIGFSPKYRENLPLRRAFARSLNYKDLQNLFQSPGLPGCPGIPSHLLAQSYCIQFDLVEAVSEWQNLKTKPSKIEIIYSKQGGDDHRRSMEWLQTELKKNLKVNSEASSMDNQVFIERLIAKPGDLFRKGLAPSRPTCYSALQAFLPGHPENFIQFADPHYEDVLAKLSLAKKEAEQKKLCSEAVEILLKDFWLIPTGPIHFTLLARPEWKGWKLSELNQLDLSELELR
jgi:oligopeptide transport system substrate-binding protein